MSIFACLRPAHPESVSFLCLWLLGFGVAAAGLQAADLSGTVRAPDKTAAVNVPVTLRQRGTNTVLRATTNAQGTFTVRDVPAGVYTAEVRTAGFDDLTQPVTVSTKGPAPRLDLVLSSADSIPGTADRVIITGTAILIGQPPDAEGIHDVVITNGATGNKANTPVTSVDQDIVAVPQKVIQDQNDTSVREALENVSGVTNSGGTRDISEGTELVRGFPISNFFRNGFQDESTGIGTFLPWNGDAERVELLKGASALLYGPAGVGFGGIGGLVNTTTKKPLLNPAYTLVAQGDSNGGWSTLFDVSHPLTSNGTWLARGVGEINDKESYVDDFHARQDDGYVVVQGLLDSRTALTLSAEWVHQDNTQYFGLPAYGTILPAPAASPYKSFSDRFNIEDPNSHEYYDGGRFQAILERKLTDNWSLRLAFGADLGRRQPNQFFIGPTGNYASTGLFYEYTIDLDVMSVTYFGDATLQGKFKTFGLEHQLVAGFQGDDALTHFTRANDFTSYHTSTDLSVLQISRTPGPLTPTENDHPDTRTLTAYFNDLIKVTPWLTVSGGVSYVNARNSDSTDAATGAPGYSDTQDGVGFRVGPIFQITKSLFAFFDYSSAYLPVPPQLQDNGVLYTDFKAITGDQYELGLKYDVAKFASITAAIYQITENNVLTTDPVNPDLEIQSGEQRSRGAELDAALHPAAGWDVIVAAAYTDAKVIQDNTFITGSRLTSVPHWSGRIYSTYEFPSGPLKGFGFGGNIDFATDRPADVPTTDAPTVGTLPGYAKFDAQVFYERAGWRASLNVINLFDIHYYDSAQNLARVIPGEPLTASFRLQKTF